AIALHRTFRTESVETEQQGLRQFPHRRHCEEQSDEAIHTKANRSAEATRIPVLDCFAALAMTTVGELPLEVMCH
ncbi:MAG: hypothetical protein LBI59_05460, partial [Candidatus Accumulibacter sp.]|nr:hypothetical protein [Accumulibacter sp.]